MWGDGRIKQKPVGCRQLHLKAKTTRKKNGRKIHQRDSTRQTRDRRNMVGPSASLLFLFLTKQKRPKDKTTTFSFPLAPINLRSTVIVFSFSNAIFISKMEGKYSFLNMLLKVVSCRETMSSCGW